MLDVWQGSEYAYGRNVDLPSFPSPPRLHRSQFGPHAAPKAQHVLRVMSEAIRLSHFLVA